MYLPILTFQNFSLNCKLYAKTNRFDKNENYVTFDHWNTVLLKHSYYIDICT